jgi:hypothetical protein
LRQKAVSIGELGREAIQWYWDHAKRDLYTFSNRMELIIRELGSRWADSVKPKEIEGWLASHTKWSAATKNRYKTVLSKAYQLALKSDRVTRNPARLVERRNEGDGRIRYLRADEEVRLRTVIERRCRGHLPALFFALHTGLRKSEQFTVAWSDIDFDRRVIIVPHPKNDRSREVTMSDTCLALLEKLHTTRPDEGRVFRSDRYKKQPITDNLIARLEMRQRARLAMAAAACALAMLALSQLPPVGELIEQRINTFSAQSQDVSYSSRIEGHQEAFRTLVQEPFGEGLGSTDTDHFTEGDYSIIGPHDSTLLEFLYSLGWIGTLIYGLGLGSFVVQLVRTGLMAHP